jgi:hypothetical protein
MITKQISLLFPISVKMINCLLFAYLSGTHLFKGRFQLLSRFLMANFTKRINFIENIHLMQINLIKYDIHFIIYVQGHL